MGLGQPVEGRVGHELVVLAVLAVRRLVEFDELVVGRLHVDAVLDG